MGLTISDKKRTVVGEQALVTFTVAFDSSYPTGGESLTPEDLGFINHVDVLSCSPKSGVLFEYDYTNKKLKAVFPTGGAGTPAAALAVPVATIAAGATTVTGASATPGVAISPGVGKEVASTQNLSTLTAVRGFAIGV